MSWHPEQHIPNQSNPYGDYPPASSPNNPYNEQQAYGPQQPYNNGSGSMGNSAAYSAGAGASSMGMQPNVAAGLSYIAGWITGIVFFLLEKRNTFVRFHAMQSILFFGGLSVLSLILSMASWFSPSILALAFSCVSGLLGLVGFIGWIVLLINGFQGKYFKLPVIGDYAERYANQGINSL